MMLVQAVHVKVDAPDALELLTITDPKLHWSFSFAGVLAAMYWHPRNTSPFAAE